MSQYEKLTSTQQFACRVIADHARTTAFAIADGIMPGPKERNFVLRKIMRRAIYSGRRYLGFEEPFFFRVCDFVVEKMSTAYPELETQRGLIKKIVIDEEKHFSNTLTAGLANFIADFEESQSPIKKLFEIIGNEIKKTDSTSGLTQDKIREYMDERKTTYEGKSTFSILADLSFKYKIPPYLVRSYLEVTDDHILRRGKGSFQRGFANALYTITTEKGSETEKLHLDQISQQGLDKMMAATEILSFFDSYFEGSEEYKVANFKSFARNYDTFGTPRDLLRVALEERGILIDENLFNHSFDVALLEVQKQSGIGQTHRKSELSPIYAEVLDRIGWNKFHGYDGTTVETANVVAIVDGDSQKDSLAEGEQGSVVLDETPFYAESGGQVGDTGYLTSARLSTTPSAEAAATPPNQGGEFLPPAYAGGTDFRAVVADTYSPVAGLIIHKVKVESGTLKVGDKVTAVVDRFKRDATRRNHTATHLLHAALKEVLGTHVKQAGSVVAPNYLRFDFSHYQPMSEAEIQEVEDLVNRYVLQNHQVNTSLMAIEEAMRSGAVAMFGEKYGAEVRVLSVGDGKFSMELCGGTHVRATGDIGSFKITSDEAIASGVRRIRAITGFDAFERFREDERLIDRSLEALKTQRDNLPNAIERLQEEVKRTRKEIEELKLKIATGAAGGASSNEDEALEIAGVKVLAKVVDGLDANGQRQLSDTLLARLKSGVVVLGRKDDGKASIIVRVSDDLKDRVKAGNVIKEIVPIIGGKGGGRPDMAEGGGPDADKLSEAIEAGYKVIETFLSP